VRVRVTVTSIIAFVATSSIMSDGVAAVDADVAAADGR